jgi:hypothetical protein
MKVNKDKYQVVVSREMYDDLMRLAIIGDYESSGNGETAAKVRRHVRKYNKHMHEERQVEVAKDAAEYRRLRSKVIALISTHGGEMVWRKSKTPPPPGLSEGYTFYLGCKVVGRSELNKLCVKVRNMDGTGNSDIHIDALLTELPEGYEFDPSGMTRFIAYDSRVLEPRKPYQIKRGS